MNIQRLKVSLGSLSTRTPLKVKSSVLVLYAVLKKSDRIPNRCRDRFDENSNSNAQKNGRRIWFLRFEYLPS